MRNKYLNNFVRGILAGAAIGVGGLLNILCLSISQKILGGILFSAGLFTVCYFSLHLYTGKIGYLTENKKDYLLSLLIMYLGNIVGAVAFGYLLRIFGLINVDSISKVAMNVANKKFIDFGDGRGQSVLNMLGLSFLCGNFVFIGVDIYKKNKNWVIKILGIVIAVATFVILGMEHCIADLFYLAFANAFTLNFGSAVLAILIATIGNSLGALLLHFVINSSILKEHI